MLHYSFLDQYKSIREFAPLQSLRVGESQKGSLTTNHSLYQTQLNFSKHQLSWGKLRMEPATRWLDESFAPLLNSDERFARQHRIKSIHQCFHWLHSYQAKIAIFRVLACMLSTQSPFKETGSWWRKESFNSLLFPLKKKNHFHYALWDFLFPIGLACMLISLVRVTRRDELVHHWIQHYFSDSPSVQHIRKAPISLFPPKEPQLQSEQVQS